MHLQQDLKLNQLTPLQIPADSMSVHTFHRKVLAIHLSCTGHTAEDCHTPDSSGPTVHNPSAGNNQQILIKRPYS